MALLKYSDGQDRPRSQIQPPISPPARDPARSSSFAFSSLSALPPSGSSIAPWATSLRSMSSTLPQHTNPVGSSGLAATSAASAAATALSNASSSTGFPARGGRFASLISPGIYDTNRGSNSSRRFTANTTNGLSHSFSGTMGTNSRPDSSDPVDLSSSMADQLPRDPNRLRQEQEYIKSILREFHPVDAVPDDTVRTTAEFSRLAPFVGHQSEPTTPPEHRQTRGFPPPLSHPTRRVSPTMSMAQMVQTANSLSSSSGSGSSGFTRPGGHAFSFSGLGSTALNEDSYANIPSISGRVRANNSMSANNISMTGLLSSSSDDDDQVSHPRYNRGSADPPRSSFQFSSALADIPRQSAFPSDQRSSSVSNLGPIGTSATRSAWTSVRPRAGRQSLPLNPYGSLEEDVPYSTNDIPGRATVNHRNSMGNGPLGLTLSTMNNGKGMLSGMANTMTSLTAPQHFSSAEEGPRVTFSALESLATRNNTFFPSGPLNQYASDRTLPGLGDIQLPSMFDDGMRAPGPSGANMFGYGPGPGNHQLMNGMPVLGGNFEPGFIPSSIPTPESHHPLHSQPPQFTSQRLPDPSNPYGGVHNSPTWYDPRYSWPPEGPLNPNLPSSQPNQPQLQPLTPFDHVIPQQEPQQSAAPPSQVPGPIDSQARVIQQRRMANSEETMRFNNAPLESFTDRIYQTSKDQHGCRYLQKKLEEQNPDHVKLIYLETKDHIVELMTDPFGNYLCQKLLEFADDEQRTTLIQNAAPEMVKIGLNQHGTRALQKMIEFVSTSDQVDAIVKAFKDSVVDLIKDLNGNHVIQKCLNHMEPEDVQFIFEAVGNNCVTVGTHRHGCCVLQRCLDHANLDQKKVLVQQITDHAIDLVQDPFGNYVVQYILDIQNKAYTAPLCRSFHDRVATLSRQKFSSNVMEKCIRCSDPDTRRFMVEELINAKDLELVVKDSFGNYVVQTAMEHSEPDLRLELCASIRPLIPAIRNTPHGRRILQRLQDRDHPASPSNEHSSISSSPQSAAVTTPTHSATASPSNSSFAATLVLSTEPSKLPI